MAFRLNPTPTFTRPVAVRVPEGEAATEVSFRATFRFVPEDEVADLAETDGGKALLRRAVAAVLDVEDEAGKPLPDSDALRETLYALPYVRVALAQTYFRAVSGLREGN